MKNPILLSALFLLFLSSSYLSCNRGKNKEPAPQDSFTLYSAPELSPLITNWVGVYEKLHPEVKINVVDVTGKDPLEGLNKSNALAFFAGDADLDRTGISPWKEVVGREVIVTVMNTENPYADNMTGFGLSPEKLGEILSGEEDATWEEVVASGGNLPLHVFMKDDASVGEAIAKFTGLTQPEIRAERVNENADLIAAIQGDNLAIGICRLTDVIDQASQSIAARVQLLPLDADGSGTLDFKESIYDDLNSFSRGVWIGKYPGSLVNEIYSVSASQPDSDVGLAFLKWIFSNGQRLLDNHGFTVLEPSERLAMARAIDNYGMNAPETAGAVLSEPLFSNIYFLALLVVLGIVLFLTVAGILVRERKKDERVEQVIKPQLVFNEEFIRSPQGLYYDKSHTWAFMDETGMVKIGIDDFLQHVTGTLTNIKLKSPGEKVRKGKHVFSVIQDGKQLEICTPVSGTIMEVNPLLANNASLMNLEPYKNGWVYKIEPAHWLKEIKFMILGSKYREWINSEITRLKEFFAESLRPETSQYSHILQDGGELSDGLLKDFGPVVWEDFQTQFLDVPS